MVGGRGEKSHGRFPPFVLVAFVMHNLYWKMVGIGFDPEKWCVLVTLLQLHSTRRMRYFGAWAIQEAEKCFDELFSIFVGFRGVADDTIQKAYVSQISAGTMTLWRSRRTMFPCLVIMLSTIL